MRLPGAMTLMTLRRIIDATRARMEGIIQSPVISVIGWGLGGLWNLSGIRVLGGSWRRSQPPSSGINHCKIGQ
jgi:hypothetical protein